MLLIDAIKVLLQRFVLQRNCCCQVSVARFVAIGALVALCISCSCDRSYAQHVKGSANPYSQTSGDKRVTVLGISRGIAFLKDASPLLNAEKESGPYPVAWVQTAVFVENLKDSQPIRFFKIELKAADGSEYVVPSNAKLASKVTQSMTTDPRLPALLFPVKVPSVADPSRCTFFILWKAGTLYQGDKARLEIAFSDDGKSYKQKFDFILPRP